MVVSNRYTHNTSLRLLFVRRPSGFTPDSRRARPGTSYPRLSSVRAVREGAAGRGTEEPNRWGVYDVASMETPLGDVVIDPFRRRLEQDRQIWARAG